MHSQDPCKKTFKTDKLETQCVDVNGVISGVAITGYFDELYCKDGAENVSVCDKLEDINEKMKPTIGYGLWLSGCANEHLYLDYGTETEVGLEPHCYHLSGYRAFWTDEEGLDDKIHIHGMNVTGLLTIDYPL